jgi:hypothetical protein
MAEAMPVPWLIHIRVLRDICRRLTWFSLLLLTLLLSVAEATAEEEKDYLYYREISIAPYQNMREFFDLPDRAGVYDVTLLSQAMTPLTFHLIRLHGDEEKSVKKKRSFHLGNHRFEYHMNNPKGDLDLAVEVANSNPTMKVKVIIVVVEIAPND